jgi:hypothetical protein
MDLTLLEGCRCARELNRAVAEPQTRVYIPTMQTSPNAIAMLGVFNPGDGEIILVLALVLIFFWSDNLPRIGRWLWERSDNSARDAGRSVGGIYGKGAFQAITPDNRVAELYRPKVLEPKHDWRKRRRGFVARMWSRLWQLIRSE